MSRPLACYIQMLAPRHVPGARAGVNHLKHGRGAGALFRITPLLRECAMHARKCSVRLIHAFTALKQ